MGPGGGHLAVVAADRRERAAADELARRGVPVRTWQVETATLDPELFTGAAALLGPVRLPAAAHAALHLLPAGAPVFVGLIDPTLREAAARRDLRLRSYTDDDAFAIRNAVPTAEGAVAEATRLSGTTVHGAAAVVLGYGRCGQALQVRLTAWHADVAVVARRPEQLALAGANGARPVPWSGLTAALAGRQLIFNTVPARVLGPRELAAVAPGAWVIDIASAPGGVDLAEAEAMGVNARLLPALPGRLYPETAGRLVAETVYPWLPPVLRQSEV